jgi:hypothetical protein
VNVADLRQALDEVFDEALMYHGFTDYMRDYEAIVQLPTAPRTGPAPVHRRYLFRHCVQASCQTALPPRVWRRSLADLLVEFPDGLEPDGFVWGVRWQSLYPGASVVAESAAAARWTRELGIEFHEVRIQTNVHDLTLVFSELLVSDMPEGYVPFRVST